MKLFSVTCPKCGGKLDVTPNSKMVTCEYCKCDFLIEDEIKRIRLDNAEQVGYDFEKGRQRALEDIEKEKKRALQEREKERMEAAQAAAKAVCTACGKTIVVDKRYEDATCCYCNTVIKVAPAIDLKNGYLKENELYYEEALVFYHKVLSACPNNNFAVESIRRVKEKMANHVYINTENCNAFSKNDLLAFRRDKVTFTNGEGNTVDFYYSQMTEVEAGVLNLPQFRYPGYGLPIILGTTVDNDQLLDFIMNAQKGLYPSFRWKPLYKSWYRMQTNRN